MKANLVKQIISDTSESNKELREKVFAKISELSKEISLSKKWKEVLWELIQILVTLSWVSKEDIDYKGNYIFGATHHDLTLSYLDDLFWELCNESITNIIKWKQENK